MVVVTKRLDRADSLRSLALLLSPFAQWRRNYSIASRPTGYQRADKLDKPACRRSSHKGKLLRNLSGKPD